MLKTWVTGATGFIGSNIAKHLIDQGNSVIATHRNSSNFEKCNDFADRIEWVNTDKSDWEANIINSKPDILIHTAWGGIDASQRNDWGIQLENFEFSRLYFDLAKKATIKKVVALGSQAEYGNKKYAAKEEDELVPEDAYGAVKILTTNYLRAIFNASDTTWYWIRIYSLFGENENPNWLIPSTVSRILKNETINLTACEQIYNYLYIGDFLNYFDKIINDEKRRGGVYNICNSDSIRLKDFLMMTCNTLNADDKLLNFGALPYRPNQNMKMMGNNSKFTETFEINESELLGMREGMKRTINYHKQKQQ